VKINESQENIVELSDIREKKLRALSPYGPVKAGLTTLPDQEIARDAQLARLSGLLSSLENVVERLNYKSFTAYATLMLATENLRAVLYDTVIGEGGTDETS
jgi:hypothetical protein